MNRPVTFCLTVALSVSPALAADVAHGRDIGRPVRIGGDVQSDACGGMARVVGLNPKGDNFLAVKAAPNMAARRVDKLGPGTRVYVCDSGGQGDWVGIVYEASGKQSERCGVSTPLAVRRPYRGPCLSGWVANKYLQNLAG